MKPNEVNLGIKEEEYASDGDDDGKKSQKSKKVKKESKSTKKLTDKVSEKKADKKRKSTSGDDEQEGGARAKKAKKQSAYTISENLAELLGLERNDTRYQVYYFIVLCLLEHALLCTHNNLIQIHMLCFPAIFSICIDFNAYYVLGGG